MSPDAVTSSPRVCPGYDDRLKLANAADHVVLPEVISKEPLGPMVRHGDDQWFDIVKWTLYAMITAEELGITQKNLVDTLGWWETTLQDFTDFIGWS